MVLSDSPTHTFTHQSTKHRVALPPTSSILVQLPSGAYLDGDSIRLKRPALVSRWRAWAQRQLFGYPVTPAEPVPVVEYIIRPIDHRLQVYVLKIPTVQECETVRQTGGSAEIRLEDETNPDWRQELHLHNIRTTPRINNGRISYQGQPNNWPVLLTLTYHQASGELERLLIEAPGS